MLWDDLQTQRATVADLEAQLAAAREKLRTLEASAVNAGPDVSEYQGDVDWAKVKAAPYSLAFVRISDGDQRDKLYSQARVTSLRGAGLILGTYYFARVASAGNGERNGRSECAMAVYFAESMGALKKGDLPLAYDLETPNGQAMPKVAAHAVEWIKAYRYLKGTYPLLYTTPSFGTDLATAMDDEQRAVLVKCPLWVAHFGVDKPQVPAPWTSWTFWQYVDKGACPGVTTAVDLNYFSGTRAELDALRIA